MSTPGYTVRRLGWFQPPHGDPYTRRVPTAVPVARFGTFDEAEERRRELEAAARAGENPFRFGGCSVSLQSSLDGPRLHDWLMDEGIDPPVSQLRHADWGAWWAAFAHTWTEAQLHHAWAAFDKVRFFDVAEEPERAAHGLVEIIWGGGVPAEYGHGRRAITEGGRLVGVYRREARAATVRAELTRPRAEGGGQFRYDWRVGYEDGPRGPVPAREATFYEVQPIPSDVPEGAGAGFLVQRRVITDGAAGTAWGHRPPAAARVPVALFARRPDAAAERDRLEAEWRRVLNPFMFAPLSDTSALSALLGELDARALPLPFPPSLNVWEWIEWWDLCQDDFTDGDRAALWEAIDRPVFEALRVEVGDD